MKSYILCFLVLAFMSVGAWALESGELIPCGAEGGLGPLSTYGVVNEPLGTARVLRGAEPDLFIRTTKHGKDPGLFLYRFVKRAASGEPVFALHARVGHSFKDPFPPAGAIVQTKDEVVHALWVDGTALRHSTLDLAEMRFVDVGTIAIDGLPRGIGSCGVVLRDNGSAMLVLGVGDGTPYDTSGISSRAPEYDPYNGRGMWRGGMPYSALYAANMPQGLGGPAEPAKRVSPKDRDVRGGYFGLSVFSVGNTRGILTGSHFGEFHFYANPTMTVEGFAPRVHVVDDTQIAMRHPSIHPAPVAYPNPETSRMDFIAAGEGACYWYRFTGNVLESGKPQFEASRAVLEPDAKLYGGTLPVVSVVDWDGDGDKDLVAGNSEGFVQFFENAANDQEPRFLPGVRMSAGGDVIHLQPGYALDIQGPFEARWGYVSPTVVDWNQDGLLDVVLSDSTARHTYYRNVGSATAPELARGVFIQHDGLELHGTWRVQPAAGLMGGRMAYIALDGDDELHLYWQEDPHNVTEGFKLTLSSGGTIRANFLDGGGTGRSKIVLTDWDGDGVKDLILGTPRHGSVPEPVNGLPKSLGLPGAAVLFLKNEGDESAPRYADPRILAFRGKPLYFGQHECSPAIADFGQADGPGLIVGREEGRFAYFGRGDLSTLSRAEVMALGTN